MLKLQLYNEETNEKSTKKRVLFRILFTLHTLFFLLLHVNVITLLWIYTKIYGFIEFHETPTKQ